MATAHCDFIQFFRAGQLKSILQQLEGYEMRELTKSRLETIIREHRSYEESLRRQAEHDRTNVEAIKKAFEDRATTQVIPALTDIAVYLNQNDMTATVTEDKEGTHALGFAGLQIRFRKRSEADDERSVKYSLYPEAQLVVWELSLPIPGNFQDTRGTFRLNDFNASTVDAAIVDALRRYLEASKMQ